MMLNEKLLEGAIKIAFEADYDCFIGSAGETDVPPALDRRIKKQITAQKRRRFALKYSRLTAVFLVFVMCAGAAVWFSGTITADAPVYSMVTETQLNSLYIWFVRKDDKTQTPAESFMLKHATAAGALDEYIMTASYTTKFAHIEEYDNGKIRFEQTALNTGGITVIETGNTTVKNIIIGGYPAILVFGDDITTIFWRDEYNSYMLTGTMSSDDAMRSAREIRQ
ncbi:MAG: DUF4367 domain-containing protein [Eubacteriales bacterium]|jgi:hypothetical protein|nr:DUF4367 domain-containing protein [Eubacteriales bacterium]